MKNVSGPCTDVQQEFIYIFVSLFQPLHYNKVINKLNSWQSKMKLFNFNVALSSEGIRLPGRLGQSGEESHGGNDRGLRKHRGLLRKSVQQVRAGETFILPHLDSRSQLSSGWFIDYLPQQNSSGRLRD